MENDRLTKLRAKLKARKGKAGYEKNCEAIQSEIERIEAILDAVRLASEKKSRKAKPK